MNHHWTVQWKFTIAQFSKNQTICETLLCIEMFVFVHLFIISWERKSQTLCMRMHPNRWLRVKPQRTMVIHLSLTHFVDITFRAHVSAPLTYHPCHLADKVRVWGQGDQAGDDVLRLHHHEPRLRRSNGASRQPQGSLQAHRHDGAQLRAHCRGSTAGCPAVRWLHSLIVLLFFVKFRGACRWLFSGDPVLRGIRVQQDARQEDDPDVQAVLWAAVPAGPLRLWHEGRQVRLGHGRVREPDRCVRFFQGATTAVFCFVFWSQPVGGRL